MTAYEPSLDVALAEQRADEAARRAEEGTQRALHGAHSWVRLNLQQHLDALIASRVEFTSDDLRRRAEVIGTSPNVVGALIRSASKAGRIRCTGYRQSERPEAHARVVRVWKATEVGDGA